ncbi:guanine deaminase [Flocculibacter collagenilyticus]|uniref:guanine deaminase n=1 Tax=Flocculibacter collagenilyticus TaxID=2744479 RepID=UPI0018F48499|nr:guanine deaminase [Flocculibacter collagenilyticus]
MSIITLASEKKCHSSHYFRAAILHFISEPKNINDDKAWQYFEDGLLEVVNGKVISVRQASEALPSLPENASVVDYSGSLILPGFVDVHTHFPQAEMIASYGEQLLQWLENYTFVTEQKYAEQAYANKMAEFFLDMLFCHGTTAAMVFSTVHKESVTALFNAANAKNMRLITGKVLMDRNAPEALCDTAQSGYEESQALIEQWHGKGRLSYAVTPRFAPTSTPEQLTLAGKLLQQDSSLYMQTHLAENLDENAWVKTLFPDAKDYLDVYEQHGLMSTRSIFAHSIHLQEREYKSLAHHQAGVAYCPSANLFLGSGAFNMPTAQQYQLNVGLGSDVGAGTSLCLLNILSDAYKSQKVEGFTLNPFYSLYLATLGGAKCLDLEDKIGNFEANKEADFVVWDLNATPLMTMRNIHSHQLAEQLFSFIILGDDRAVVATYVNGQLAYERT